MRVVAPLCSSSPPVSVRANAGAAPRPGPDRQRDRCRSGRTGDAWGGGRASAGQSVLQRTVSDAAGAWTIRTVLPPAIRQIRFTLCRICNDGGSTSRSATRIRRRCAGRAEGGRGVRDGVGGGTRSFRRSRLWRGHWSGRGVGAALPAATHRPGHAGSARQRPPLGAQQASRALRPHLQCHCRRLRHRLLRGRSKRTSSGGVTEFPLSTFSIDVDTASYANVRRFLNDRDCHPRMRCASRR